MKDKSLLKKWTVKAIFVSLLVSFAGVGKGFAYSFASEAPTGQMLYYESSSIDQCVTLTYPGASGWENYPKPQGNLVIPSTVSHNGVEYTVVGINMWAFQYCTGLTSIVIPNTIKYLYPQCFLGCSNLYTISLGSSIKLITLNCFQGTGWYNSQNDGIVYLDGWCLGIKGNIEIEEGLLEIQDGTRGIGGIAFANHDDITTVIIPNSVETICAQAFYNCQYLSMVSIGESVKNIMTSAFENCVNLTTITIPGSIEYIGYSAFGECYGLTSVFYTGDISQWCNISFEDNPVSYAHNLFINDELLTDLVFPEDVTIIKDIAFLGATCLSSVTFSGSVREIGSGAFADCSNLTSIIVPSSVTMIGIGAFSGCSNVETIIVETDNTVYDSRGYCNAIIETSTNTLIQGCKNTKVPNTVNVIETASFSGHIGLVSITMPASLNSIGSDAFYGCDNLTTITVLSINPPVLEAELPCSAPGFTIFVPAESLAVYKQDYYWESYKDYMQPISTLFIHGYAESDGNWYFISSPLAENVLPTEVDEMLAINESDHDMYQFNQSAIGEEWRNYKANPFELVNGQGYLYANKEDVNLIFKGEFNEDETKEVELVFDAGKPFAGWNLVGNPFPVSAYADRSYYVMNESGTAITPVEVSSATAIPACTGLMVKVSNTNETVTFSKTAPRQKPNQGTLQIAVAEHKANRNETSIEADKAIVSFNEGDKLSKFVFNHRSASLYIPQGDKKFAIAESEKTGEMPLNFETAENGRYTISIDTKDVEMTYLHLIDNLTGNDIDLLETPYYTFEAKTTDYASRFKVVFAQGGSTNEDNFAFMRDSHLLVLGIEGQATLQVIDITGRVLANETFSGNYDRHFDMPTGVYVLRLINGSDVRTQKIIIK